MTDISALIDLITRGGLLSALIIALLGGMKGWYVWGYQHKAMMDAEVEAHAEAIKEKNQQIEDMKEDRDYWRTQARSALSTTGRAVGVVEASSRKLEV